MEIKNNTEDDLIALKQIADLTLGEGYADSESILNAEISINAHIDNEIVGYATAYIDYPSCLGSPTQLDKLYKDKTGIIGNVATHPNHQRKGIGLTLTEELIKRLKEMSQTSIVASAWRSKTGVNIGRIFEKLGFQEVIEIPSFWSGTSCIQCSPEECTCPAVIYELKV